MSSPTAIGSVQDVRGATLGVVLDSTTISGLTFIEGRGYRIGQIGSFVRIPMGYVDLFGVVSQVGAGAVPATKADTQPFGNRWMTVQLMGEAPRLGGFRRGLSQYPTIGDIVHFVTEPDLGRIYERADSAEYIELGSVSSAETIPALVNANKLVMRHSAILGTTGSGKSTTVAKILGALSDGTQYPSARVLVLDLHGEYHRAFGERASVFRVTGLDALEGEELPLHVPYWAMTLDELVPITFGVVDDIARGAIAEKILDLKRNAPPVPSGAVVAPELVTVDTPLPFSIHQLWFDLHRLVNATHTVSGNSNQSPATEAFDTSDGKPTQPGDPLRVIPPRYLPITQGKVYVNGSTLNIRRQLDGLASRLRDARYDFLFRPGEWLPETSGKVNKDLDVLLQQWIGGNRPISILDLSGVPTSVLKHLVGSLLRIVYDALLWGRRSPQGGRERPLLVVLEEAHNYAAPGDSGSAALAVRRIVKEGRKYGIGAMIVSQRPAEIDATVLSQCGTIIALRLTNSTDRGHIASVVSDELADMMGVLPILRTGEALVLGEAVQLPMRVVVDPPPEHRRPDSRDPLVFAPADESGGWNKARSGDPTEQYRGLVQTWRRQDVSPPKSTANDASGKKRKV